MPEKILTLLLPFIGTVLGAGTVFIVKKNLKDSVMKSFNGFAAGVMFAAAIWSLIIPSFEFSEDKGKLAFIPVVVGLVLGFLFLMLLDKVVPHQHIESDETEGISCNLKKTTMTSLAVALHNLPEGIAVGVVLASSSVSQAVPISMAIALSIGIAIQNFPEGAIISLPLRQCGIKKEKTFVLGVLSGAVEPIAALITMLFIGVITPALPYLLSFAAGAMIFVVVEELIPEMTKGKHSHFGTVFFFVGFMLMMVLDVVLN